MLRYLSPTLSILNISFRISFVYFVQPTMHVETITQDNSNIG